MCSAPRLSHSKNGLVIVTFQPSLSIVGEDLSRIPSNPFLGSASMRNSRHQEEEESAGKAEVDLV